MTLINSNIYEQRLKIYHAFISEENALKCTENYRGSAYALKCLNVLLL